MATERKKYNMIKDTPISKNSSLLARLVRISEHKIASYLYMKKHDGLFLALS